MYKNVMQAIDGIQLYPLISLVIFFTFFAILLIWVFRLDKKTIREMENLPLDEKKDNVVLDLNGGKTNG